MSTHDDPQFERYLKQFRPLGPEALAKRRPGVRSAVPAFAWAAAAGVILGAILLSISFHTYRTHSSLGFVQSTRQEVDGKRLVTSKSLTVRNATTLLATAPSFEEAIDDVTVAPETVPLPKDKHSALAILSMGPTKL